MPTITCIYNFLGVAKLTVTTNNRLIFAWQMQTINHFNDMRYLF